MVALILRKSGCSTRDDTLARSSGAHPRMRASVARRSNPPSSRRRKMTEPRCTIRGAASCAGLPNIRRQRGRHPSGCRTKSPKSAGPPVPAGRTLAAGVPRERRREGPEKPMLAQRAALPARERQPGAEQVRRNTVQPRAKGRDTCAHKDSRYAPGSQWSQLALDCPRAAFAISIPAKASNAAQTDIRMPSVNREAPGLSWIGEFSGRQRPFGCMAAPVLVRTITPLGAG